MEQNDIRAAIDQSAKENRVLRIKYTNQKDETQFRNVEPYEYKGDHLFAYCRKKKNVRRFDLKKIESAKLTSYTYFPKWPVKIGQTDLTKTAAFNNPYLYTILTSLFGSYNNAILD
jgi:predicted DNA-binding transcriptional regulator YafY